MTAEPRRHDCPNCDPTPAVSTETVRGGRRLNTPTSAARSDHPVPEQAARAHARFDTDPDALAWARTKVQHQLDLLAAFERDAIETGRPETAAGLSVARCSTAQMLIGGSGCVVGAFDERRPLMFGTPSGTDGASAADTLPEWLCQRYRRYAFPFDNRTWADLPDEDRSYWVHEAAAVRRAVARGGFKTGGSGV